MAARFVLFACAQILLVQSIAADCGCRWNGYGNALAERFAGERCAAERIGDIYAAERYSERLSPFGYGLSQFEYGLPYAGAAAASYGGGLPVASSSPIPASGVSILSENAIEGPLAVAGQLPFLGTVALEGALPTLGAGAVNYGCGNGNVGMLSEGNGLGAYGLEMPYGAYGLESAYGARYGPYESIYGSAFGPAGFGYGPCNRF